MMMMRCHAVQGTFREMRCRDFCVVRVYGRVERRQLDGRL